MSNMIKYSEFRYYFGFLYRVMVKCSVVSGEVLPPSSSCLNFLARSWSHPGENWTVLGKIIYPLFRNTLSLTQPYHSCCWPTTPNRPEMRTQFFVKRSSITNTILPPFHRSAHFNHSHWRWKQISSPKLRNV